MTNEWEKRAPQCDAVLLCGGEGSVCDMITSITHTQLYLGGGHRYISVLHFCTQHVNFFYSNHVTFTNKNNK